MNTKLSSFVVWTVIFVFSIVVILISTFWLFESSSLLTFFDTLLRVLKYFWLDKLMVILSTYILWIYILSYLLIKYLFEKIERVNKNLTEYNKYLAHEIKTPVSIISSNLEILEYEDDKKRIYESKKELKKIISITDSLLAFSENSSLINKEFINIENFIKKISGFNKWKIRIHNKWFNVSIKTDEKLFERVVDNMINNAIKYSADSFVDIYITNSYIKFENKILKTLSDEEIEDIKIKNRRKSYSRKEKWNWIWLPMVIEICNILWLQLILESKENKFISIIKMDN